MDYFLSSNPSQVSKSAACDKMLVSRGSIYYKPKLPAKDLALKSKIEAVTRKISAKFTKEIWKEWQVTTLHKMLLPHLFFIS